MYDGCPPADPRSNGSLIPLSQSFRPSLSLLSSIVARVLAYPRALYGTAIRRKGY